MKYVVIEIQTNEDGVVSNIVTAHDEMGVAYQRYYTVCAAAAVSGLPVHSGALMTNEGRVLETKCFWGDLEVENG